MIRPPVRAASAAAASPTLCPRLPSSSFCALSATTLTIAENAAAGTLVGYLRITNPDVFRAETFKVSLSDQSGALVAGPYDAATGLVAITVSTDPKKAAKLDFEKFKLGRFVLTAVVTDSGFISNDGSKQGAKSSAKATFAVQLTDVGGA